MPPARAENQRCRRWAALALATILAGVTITGSADARARHHYRHHHSHHVVSRYSPPYASIVVDANSGKVLQATNADSPRHPASLTKMMTLYLLFEQLAAGKVTMATEMPVSAHAASMAPTKLGLEPGEHLSVSDAIQGIVTQSANDAAVVVAEFLGGTETAFAREMTAKAHALGMMHTNYHNASGLPDEAQISTARDESILARALQDRFPQYFHYFSLRSFVYHGHLMRNHNHLLGRDGIDGMKTGFINESGFNIVTDLHRRGRHLVVVVFGGPSARVRDAHVMRLIDTYFKEAAVKHTAPLVAEGWQRGAVAQAKAVRNEREGKQAAATPLPPPPPMASPGSTAPIKPIPVKTVMVQEPKEMHTASLSPLPPAGRKLRPATGKQAAITTVPVHRWPEEPAKAAGNEVASAGPSGLVPHVAEQLAAKPHGGWMIQVGAFDVEKDAKERLTLCQSKAKAELGDASPFTEPVAKGAKTLYRARFAGLDREQAETACKHLKHSEIPCMLLRN